MTDAQKQDAESIADDSMSRKRSRARRIPLRKKLAFALMVPLLFFGILEAGLWLYGVRPLRDVSDPFLDFVPGPTLFTQVGDEYRTTKARLTYFNSQTFAAVKPADTKRIFCLGGSTTFGRPYDDETSYVGWLRELLAESDSSQQWEVINCGGISYASYRLARLTEELIQYEPDLFIIYTGHNEFLEDRTYRDVKESGVLTRAGISAISRLRTATVLNRIFAGRQSQPNRDADTVLADEVDAILDHTTGPTSYERDPERRRQIVRHFRGSLGRMCRAAGSVGAEVVLVTPACNLRDFSPFKSDYSVDSIGTKMAFDEHLARGKQLLNDSDSDAALAEFEAAVALDGQHAHAAWLAAQAAVASGKCESASRYALLARDEDICPLRAPREILDAVTETGRVEDVPVVDFSRLVAQNAMEPAGCPVAGAESFFDHVHPKIETHRQLAIELLETLQKLGHVRIEEPVDQLLQRVSERVLAKVDSTQHALALSMLAQVLSWAGRDDEALRLAVQAHGMDSQHFEILAQLGHMYEITGDMEQARQTLEAAVELYPKNPLVLYRLGSLHMKNGEFAAAAQLLDRSAQTTPARAPRVFRIELFRRLGICQEQLGQNEKAQHFYNLSAQQK